MGKPKRDEQDQGANRRTFLKGTAAAAGAAFAAATAATRMAAAAESAGEKPAGGKAATEKKLPSETYITNPGSDFMADVLRGVGLQYLAINPASGFRSLHESIINHLGNKNPEIITCMHEETAAGIAHGYAKAAGKPMGIMMHGTVGLQHATMGIYNAWCDRVPMMIFASNGMQADKRRPGVEWTHSVQDAAGLVRDFVKWDDQPASLQHFAESCVRAWKFTMTAPMEPVMVMCDIELQEDGVRLIRPPHDTAAREPREAGWRRVVFAGPDGEQIELRG